VDGCKEGLMMAWNSDNLGPPTLSQVLRVFNTTRQFFPNAKIVASSMDNFIRAVQPHVNSLPVITGEIADNWIYGTGSDPWKVAALRTATRSRSAYLANSSRHAAMAAQEKQQLWNFSRQLLKGGEHTWGTDTQYGSTNLPSDVWSNAELAQARHNHSDGDTNDPCRGLNDNKRPEPPCPLHWWKPE